MGDLKVTIEHGSGLGALLNPKTIAIGAAVLVIGSGSALSSIESGLMDLIYWVFGVIAVAVVVGAYLMFRVVKHSRGRDYVRSMHGPTDRDQRIDELARLRREIALTKAARYQLEVAQRMHGHFPADYIKAEVIEVKDSS